MALTGLVFSPFQCVKFEGCSPPTNDVGIVAQGQWMQVPKRHTSMVHSSCRHILWCYWRGGPLD